MPPSVEALSCLGIAATALRSLAEAERVALEKDRRKLAWRAALFLFATPFALVAGLLLTVAGAALMPAPLRGLGMLPGFVAILGGPVLLLLRALDAFRRRGRIREDLRCGVVASFSGVPKRSIADPMAAELARAGVPLGGPPADFEVQRGTGRLWTVGGARSAAWLLLPMQSVAEVPAQAGVAAEWVKPVAVAGERELLARPRPLSDAELTEIADIRSRVLRSAVARAGRVLFFVVMLGSAAGRARGPYMPYVVVMTLAVMLGRARGTGGILRDFQAARALRRDREVGAVQIVRTRANPEAELSPAVEFLPVSRFLWTQGGEAALWRKTGVDPIRRG